MALKRARISLFLGAGETVATPIQHVLETVLPLCVTLAGALTLQDVGVVFGLIGSIGTSSLFFIFPVAMYLSSKPLKDSRTPMMTLACVCVFGLGLLIMFLGVISSLAGASHRGIDTQ